MLDKAVVCVFCMILILSITMISFDLSASVIRKITFDNICRDALHRIDLEGGMSEEVQDLLSDKLNAAGFSDVLIIAPEYVQYGDPIEFIVEAWADAFFKTSEGSGTGKRKYGYEKSVVSRRIHNNAF